jgi:hypothetical protein
LILSVVLIRPFRLVVAVSNRAVACVPVRSSASPLPTVVRHLIVQLAILASFAFVTTSLSIVQVAPLADTVMSHLSQSDNAGIACILSYTAFLVGTSSDQFQPAQ